MCITDLSFLSFCLSPFSVSFPCVKAKASADSLACAINASQGQGRGRHDEAAAKRVSHSNGTVANSRSYNPVNELGTIPDSVTGARADNTGVSVAASPAGAPTGAPKADYDDEPCSGNTDAQTIGDPQQDQESQGRKQEHPQNQNDIFSHILQACWDNSPDGMCTIEPERSEINQKARSLSEAVGVEDPVRKGKALGLVTKESCLRIDLFHKYQRIESENRSSLELFVGWHPVKDADFTHPVYKHRLRLLLKAKGVDVGDLPRDEETLKREAEEGQLLLERENCWQRRKFRGSCCTLGNFEQYLGGGRETSLC